METAIEWTFRFVIYAMTGMALETIFAVDGIERVAATKIERRVPKKYLEGFVSLYMIPLHGLGMLFLFEWGRGLPGNGFGYSALLVGGGDFHYGSLVGRVFEKGHRILSLGLLREVQIQGF